MRYTARSTSLVPRTLGVVAVGLAAAGVVGPASAQIDEPAGIFAYDSLEARVWLDRGDEPVVEEGDEVRVYYRTSHDAYAAIFRIDTDGRVELLYPQHPDADPYVIGGRDYRLLFREGSRWRVREDPGVGYFFMVASQDPMDFSLLGWDAEYDWELDGVGETVYEDPYVAIDDYVAALLPTWQTTPYALDFLEYSVGEDHDYPRFICYDCHGFRSYARWDPYARACSSYQVVVWDDPYFQPRFRYYGTRVVFARPLGPRPRYSVTARLVGSGPRPIVRSRPAPPHRTAGFKESPTRRSSVLPSRTPRGAASLRGPATSGRSVAPSRGSIVPPRRSTVPSRGAARRGIRPSATLRMPPARAGDPGRATTPRLPSVRRGVPPTAGRARPWATGRPTPPTARRPEGARPTIRERPTLRRRPPAASSSQPPPSARRAPARAPRAGPTRPGSRGSARVPRRRPGG